MDFFRIRDARGMKLCSESQESINFTKASPGGMRLGAFFSHTESYSVRWDTARKSSGRMHSRQFRTRHIPQKNWQPELAEKSFAGALFHGVAILSSISSLQGH